MDEPYRCAFCREPATCYFRRSGQEYFRCSGCGLITRKGHWYQEERVSAADYYENIAGPSLEVRARKRSER